MDHILIPSIHLTVNPLTVSIEGANQPLSAEKRQDLVCVTSGSRPPASIIWMKEDQRLPHSKDTTTNDGNTTTSVLSFIPSKDDAGKQLICRAENEIMRSGPIQDERLLEIQYKPEAKIQLGKSLDPGAIKEGSDVYFDCIIEAEPTVYKVEWRHQNRTLHHNISRGVIISNQSLVLQGVDRTNAGNYTCVGFNLEGDGESRPFYLNVMFTPTCKANQNKVYGVAKQEKASISCQVDANPSEVDFHWSFNNSAESVELSSNRVSRNGTTSTAEYTPKIELDYGTLLCWATNEIGHQQIPCVYHIIAAGRPDAVHNCSTHNTSKTSFEVRCSDGFNGGLEQSFLLEVREISSQDLKANISSPTPHFIVSQLDAGSLYQAFVYAYNGKGRSEPIIVQAGTLSPPEKQLTSESERPRPPMRLTPMLSVMIGVVAALVIVAVIVMIVLRIQHSQVDEQGKSPVEDNAGGKSSKPTPIQRELRFRECDSLISDEKHHPDDSPFGKLDPIPSGDCSETDEKNPDIIPQQITGEEVSEYLRKRRLVSTIETSPSRGLLERSAVAAAVGSRGNYVGYCTIRSSMPLRDLSNNTIKFKQKNMGLVSSSGGMSSEICESGMCTLPRQQSMHHHWPSPGAHSIAASSGLIPSGPTVVYTTAPHPNRGHPHHHHAATLLQRGGGAAVTVQLPPTNLECCPGMIASTTTTITTPTQEHLLPPPPPPAVAKPPLGPPQSILVNKRESSV
ncbi:hypothetical protein QAD02_001719 [Eretmocerus hayati]|uniref:Uncharacterized protein n=1 Tax=Eretmocerus hayati TaxID=131215 RepID=A0ACC2NH27_9HYME|nr:hypothetical protein QAD02_001719 [Eretmocerus hayati]